jgi:uncharacterized protein with NRDE domain
MCLIVFAWQAHPEYRLVMAANRDEFHCRPSQALHWWADDPDILAGRDLQAGGTWLASHRAGKFATVTNYREQQRTEARFRSRGELVTNFVTSNMTAEKFGNSVAGEQYAGFSLLAIDNDDLYYVSNRGDGPTLLAPGIYGLSNASLDTPWSKLLRSRERLRLLVDSGEVNEAALMHLMADREPAPVSGEVAAELPFEIARALTAPFIVSPDYGTRCSTSVMWSHSGTVALSERSFDAAGNATGDSRYSFETS